MQKHQKLPQQLPTDCDTSQQQHAVVACHVGDHYPAAALVCTLYLCRGVMLYLYGADQHMPISKAAVS